MRFSMTTIAIAILGTAMALPNPDVNAVEDRAAVSTCFLNLVSRLQVSSWLTLYV